MAKLLGYEFEIVYRFGASNRMAGALSRKAEEKGEEEKELRVITTPFW